MRCREIVLRAVKSSLGKGYIIYHIIRNDGRQAKYMRISIDRYPVKSEHIVAGISSSHIH